MKKLYETPAALTICLAEEDIVRTSNPEDNDVSVKGLLEKLLPAKL